MSKEYSVTIENKSNNCFSFCVFQYTEEEADLSNYVVWLCKRAHPDTKVRFVWKDEFCFCWAESGELERRKGAIFTTWGTHPADPVLAEKNCIGFSFTDGAYKFEKISQIGESGKLQIVTDSTIPQGKASIGYGMSGNWIYCIPATPNISRSFSMPTKYGIAFGNMNQGDFLNNTMIQQSIELSFPTNVFQRTATLREDNTWSQLI